MLRENLVAARALDLQVQILEVRDAGGLDRAFAAITRERADAIAVVQDLLFLQYRKRFADFAAKSRLPAMYGRREYADAGGLMAYGPNFLDNFRHAASFVDRILNGANPADLPVENPTKYELILNLKAARALGLMIPQSILLRADEVIE
jgi:putative ABC transport system substrate-binding protein